MPRTLTEYRVFIGSPGGLDEERKGFRATIDRFNEVHGNPTGVVFAAVGWEETLGGVGRHQHVHVARQPRVGSLATSRSATCSLSSWKCGRRCATAW